MANEQRIIARDASRELQAQLNDALRPLHQALAVVSDLGRLIDSEESPTISPETGGFLGTLDKVGLDAAEGVFSALRAAGVL